MKDETKQLIHLQLSILKQTMKENDMMFAFVVDKEDINGSSLAFLDRKEYFENGKKDGFSVSLTELNRELL